MTLRERRLSIWLSFAFFLASLTWGLIALVAALWVFPSTVVVPNNDEWFAALKEALRITVYCELWCTALTVVSLGVAIAVRNNDHGAKRVFLANIPGVVVAIHVVVMLVWGIFD